MINNLVNRTQEYLDLAGIILVVIKPDQSVELINKKGCEVLGYSKEEVEGNNWFDLSIPAEDREEVKLQFEKSISDVFEPIEYYENAVITKNNELRFIQWRNACLRDDDGRVIGIVSSGEDITLRKVLQHRLSSMEDARRAQILAAALEAQENERHEIAYELHDNVNQILTTCKILLESEIAKNPSSHFINNSYRYLQDAIDEIRNISHRLNPAQLEEIGLEGALRELIHRLDIAGRFKINLFISDAGMLKNLDYNLALSIFRIVQEQTSNIIKHADASMVDINLNLSKQYIDLEVADNGRGFELKKVVRGLGLKNIRNRAEFHKGTTYINTAPGEGCVLSVCIPLAFK